MNAIQRNLLQVSQCCFKQTNVFGVNQDVCKKYGIVRGNEIHTKHFDVPTPSKAKFRIDDELEPSRFLLLEFNDIHDSYYIGINNIEFYDSEGNKVAYKNTAVDGEEVDHDLVAPAFPTNGWWAVVGETHSLLFDFEEVAHVKYIYMWCANAASTPKHMKVSDSINASPYQLDGSRTGKFRSALYIQIGGARKKDPTKLRFLKHDKETMKQNRYFNFKEVIKSLNEDPPINGFESFLTSCRCHFVFFREGLKTAACNYYLGRDHASSISLLNTVTLSNGATIDDVAKRAMTLEELRAVRALIVSNCVKYNWKSSWDGSTLRPEDVNLYDLNSLVIKPLTKERNCAFKELFSSGQSTPTYYVSHWWGEKVW